MSVIPTLDTIQGLETRDDIAAFMAHPRSSGIAGLYVWLGLDDAKRSLVFIDQQGAQQKITGLHWTRYAPADAAGLAILDGYRRYVAAAIALAGVPDPVRRAEAVVALEARLAAGMWPEERLRSRRQNWHPMSVDQLVAFAPGFPWRTFLRARGVDRVDRVNLATDTAIQTAARVFAGTTLEDWRSYLAYHFVDNHRDLLTTELGALAFDFYGRAIGGIAEPAPIESQGIDFVFRRLADDVGRLYVEARFPEDRRREMETITGYLLQAMNRRLTEATWMDSATRIRALDKLRTMRVRVGYPREWIAPSLPLDPGDLVGNYDRILAADWSTALGRLGSPFPADYWWMGAHNVDASFSPQLNAIVFPAGILQPPAFDPAADPAVNFGAIGVIMGHEIGHGFDDQGSGFNGDGVLENWWTEGSRAAFDANAGRVIDQFGRFEALPGVRLASRQMVGEIMSDFTGVAVAYDALQAYRREHPGRVAASLGGFTPDQRFFLAWAQAFGALWSNPALVQEATTASHPPGQFRVNGVLRNFDPWYAAFGVAPGDSLYLRPADRIRIW